MSTRITEDRAHLLIPGRCTQTVTFSRISVGVVGNAEADSAVGDSTAADIGKSK